MNQKKNIRAYLFSKNKIQIICTFLLNIFSSMLMVYAGYSLSYLFNGYTAGSNQVERLITDCIVVGAIWVIAIVFYFLSGILQARTLKTMRNTLRHCIARSITSNEMSVQSEKDTGNYVSWLTNDVENIAAQSFDALFTLVTDAATTIFSIVALFFIHTLIGISAIALFFFVSVLPMMLTKKLVQANADRSAAQEKGTEGFKDAIMGFTVLLTSGRSDLFVKKIDESSHIIEDAGYMFAKQTLLVSSLITSLSVMGQIVMLALTVFTAIWGLSPISAVLSVANLSGSFFNSLNGVSKGASTIKASGVLWDKFKMPEGERQDTLDMEQGGPIVIDGLKFSYGEKNILDIKHLEFSEKGKYVLTGESGSGKTTLVKIIAGILRDYEGSVKISNREVRTLDKQSLYSRVAYVDQKVYLFQDSIRNNITLGKEYSENKLREVIDRCCLTTYIDSLPEGVDTPVAEDGKNMSGGQRQRIALARALIRDISFVIVDEGTSALDKANAKEIVNSLMQDKDIGIIFITHDLSEDMLQRADAVYVLEDGKHIKKKCESALVTI